MRKIIVFPNKELTESIVKGCTSYNKDKDISSHASIVFFDKDNIKDFQKQFEAELSFSTNLIVYISQNGSYDNDFWNIYNKTMADMNTNIHVISGICYGPVCNIKNIIENFESRNNKMTLDDCINTILQTIKFDYSSNDLSDYLTPEEHNGMLITFEKLSGIDKTTIEQEVNKVLLDLRSKDAFTAMAELEAGTYLNEDEYDER